MSTHDVLKRYYENEMAYLRQESIDFAQAYPQIAQELALSQDRCHDPHIEMLLQSFAYLTGHLRYRMDLQQAHMPNQLLSALQPHLAMPWPSMSVVQFDVDANGTSFDQCNSIKAGTLMSTTVNVKGQERRCRFRTRFAVDVWPIAVHSLQVMPAQAYAFLNQQPEIESVIHLRLSVNEPWLFKRLGLQSLRLYLDGDTRFQLYDCLQCSLRQIVIKSDQDDHPRQWLASEQLCWLGLQGEPLVPERPGAHPGLTLLREYLTFADKFLFADLQGLDVSAYEQYLDILFLLDNTPPDVQAQSIRLNATPVINLFKQAIEPITLQDDKLEYPIQGDQFNQDACEIVELDHLYMLCHNGMAEDLSPFYSGDAQAQGYWSIRREPGRLPQQPSSELFVSFINAQMQPVLPQAKTVAGQAWCCNGRLPGQLTMQHELQLDNAGPVQTAHLLRRPTELIEPGLTGDCSRQLVAQLQPHYMPLHDGQQGLNELKQLLRQHLHPHYDQGKQWINSLIGWQVKPAVHHLGDQAWKGFCHGLAVAVQIDEQRLPQGGGLLLGAVLNEVLSHYVALNSFIQMTLLDSQQRPLKRWPARIGEQALL